jgi:hypothetical protein
MGFGFLFMLALVALPVVLIFAIAGKLGTNKNGK